MFSKPARTRALSFTLQLYSDIPLVCRDRSGSGGGVDGGGGGGGVVAGADWLKLTCQSEGERSADGPLADSTNSWFRMCFL